MDELRQVVQQILAIVNEFAQSGEQIPDDVANSLSDFLEAAYQRLQPVGGGQIPPLTQAMPSSNVGAFNYDDKNGDLLVQFLGKYPNRQGPVYRYSGVPKVIFELFQRGAIPARTKGKNRWGAWWQGKVPSIGASLYTLLRESGYPYQRLS